MLIGSQVLLVEEKIDKPDKGLEPLTLRLKV